MHRRFEYSPICAAFAVVLCLLMTQGSQADDPLLYDSEVLPLPEQQVSLRLQGSERTRWHFGSRYPRPFFYPFNGPSGASLTRMGHPGAADHDHHRSLWFAHHSVNGIDFWSDESAARIRQDAWYCYQDDGEQAIMAVRLGWYDDGALHVMDQDVIAALRALPMQEYLLEIQVELRPGPDASSVRLDKTNFGLLAVRVAKSLSAHFGDGILTSSTGQTGEQQLFGKTARWMDYSGPLVVGDRTSRRVVAEGITFHDHPDNPRYPAHWHVRSDGWMGAALCMDQPLVVETGRPLRLRYLLHAHNGTYDGEQAAAQHEQFSGRGRLLLIKSPAGKPHTRYEVRRKYVREQDD